MAAMKLTDVKAKAKTEAEVTEAKQKQTVTCGVDVDPTAMMITVPLMLTEADIRVKEVAGKEPGSTRVTANIACVFRTPETLVIKVKMDDGTIRHYRVRQNAGPYGPDRYINLGFDPAEFYTVPGETAEGHHA